MSYEHRDIPVTVDYKQTEAVANDSIPAEARSVFDKNEEHGTTDGECTFAVHGLTAAEYSIAPISAIKAAALQHLTQKGDMLAIGRSDVPESMYHNVRAYPGMFPWLFPYGMGGIGHAAHKFKLGDMSRKRNLLLYHNKRFQTDLYFPMVAFNHEQLKGASTGSNILVKRSKFADISRRLLAMNPEVVANIADRMAQGEHVKPVTDAEKQCFALLSDLDVSDYVSKLGLKTYQAFASVFDVFKRNSDNLSNGAEGAETARTLMRQMINPMSTKMEIGSPMASMYILGNPDHYCSHKYVNFPWRSYVTFVKGYWYKNNNDDHHGEGDEIAEDLITL